MDADDEPATAVGRAPFRAMTLTDDRGNLCAGCEVSGRCRFGLRVRSVDDGVLTGTVYFSAEHEGAGGVVHGGSTIGALDEACGCLVLASGAFGVTAELDTRFRRPVPIEHELDIVAWADSRDERGHWRVRAEIRLPGRPEALCSVRGRFVEAVPDVHFGRFQDWLGARPPELS